MRSIVVLLLLCNLFVSGCTQKSEIITIGAILPLTGTYSENGQNALEGYQMAITEVNSRGGVNGKLLELLVESHAGDDLSGALNAYRALRIREVDIILGPNHSPTGLAVAPVACEEGVLLFSPSIGAKDFAPTCNTVLNLWPVDYQNSKALGEYAVEKGFQKVAIIGSVQSWELEQAEAVKEGVEEAGGEIVSYIITDNTATVVTTDITKIITSSSDAIIFTNYGFMHLYAKKLRESGADQQFFVVVLDESRKDLAEGAFEEAIIITSYNPQAEFIASFEAIYAYKPDFPADNSYDLIKILSQAIETTESLDPKIISDEIVSYKNYEGASGTLSFTDSGDVTKEPILQTVINNEIVIYDE